MTAMTVPPPGWAPIGARELQSSFRRNLRVGLVLSGAAHLTFLALIVWVQARNATLEPEWNATPVELVPPVTEFHVPPSVPPDWAAPTPPRTDDPGIIVPTTPIDLRKILLAGPVSEPRGGGPGVEPPRTEAGHGLVAPPLDDPPESAAVPYEAAPVPTFRPEPLYPDWCREQRIEGRVILHALVGRDGRVKRVSVVRGVKGLSEPAKAAIARWLFKPATFGGKPVAVWVEVPVEFRL